ncbi:MAG: hypothetical protein KDC87_02160, partial [Planctomycetes bacterium]|nr:hypothetical protein [Planctomycetota bacterium]
GALSGGWHLARDIVWSKVLCDDFSIEIMAFVVFLFMSIGIMTRAGGIQGMVELIRKFAKGPVSSQLCSFAVGVLIFFDDYSNCVIAGTTMRPLTDRNRVSREKLSYIVDATAAPIAGVSIFSTWVAYEVSMFAPQLPEVTKPDGSAYLQTEGFSVFTQTLPFRFYCLFTLVMVLSTIVLRREFGPMLQAARRALHDGKPIADDAHPMVSASFEKLEPEPGTRHLARNALIPVGLLVALTLVLIFVYGHVKAVKDGADLTQHRLTTYLQYTESQKALFWASLTALLAAAAMALGTRTLALRQVVASAVHAARSLGFAVVILVLAWAIGHVCKDLGTNQFLSASLGQAFAPWALPGTMFLLSALIAFSTGTSYGTMAILLPNVVVLAHNVGGTPEAGIGGSAMMLLTIGAVLEGSIFGDHCSPISDTTVLSSVSTGSDHLHHVRTQAPYAVLVMLTSLVCGYVPTAVLGPNWWPLSWLLGVTVLVLWLKLFGRDPGRLPRES